MRYISIVLLKAGAVLCLVALWNAFFDPFGVWRAPAAPLPAALSAYAMKPGIDQDPRFAKPLQVLRHTPRTVIIGSSRVRDGMDPDLLKGLVPAPVMNYGTAGLRAKEGARFVRHAIDVGGARSVIWGLDFFAFNDREMDEMGKDGFGILQSSLRIQDMGRLLIAWPTLELTGDMLAGKSISRPDGFNLAPANTPEAIDASIMRNAVGFAKVDFLYGKYDSFTAHMQEFDAALAYAASKGVRVYLYTSPLHGLLIEAIFQAGADTSFLAWKREIARIAQSHGFPVWDYMQYNSVTTAHGVQGARYFFDGAHFTPLVSRMILGRFFAVDSERPDDFGTPLTPETVDAQWKHLLNGRILYAKAQQNLVQELVGKMQ